MSPTVTVTCLGVWFENLDVSGLWAMDHNTNILVAIVQQNMLRESRNCTHIHRVRVYTTSLHAYMHVPSEYRPIALKPPRLLPHMRRARVAEHVQKPALPS